MTDSLVCRCFGMDVVAGQVQPDPQGGKAGILRQLLALVTGAGKISANGGQEEQIVRALSKREQLGSTAIGLGVAVPHSRCEAVDQMVLAAAVCVEGVNFDALDGELVHVFFLVLCPMAKPGELLRMLECISRALRETEFARSLRQCRSGEELCTILAEHEGEDQ